MNRPSHGLWLLIFFVVPLALWVLLGLFQFRVINIFDRYLMKFPGPWVTFGAMLVCPLLAVWLGRRLVRDNRRRLGRTAMAAGAVLAVAFVGLIGVPLVMEVLEPKTPKNPTAKRPIPPLVGLPVFPGAEGFGSSTPAGRGGKLMEVTSLADHGPGTLREALDDPNPRIIVFRVGGIIELEQQLSIIHPFVTVAGQTAPGDGICLKNAGLTVFTHDVLIQHLRIRPGNEGKEPTISSTT